MIVKDEARCLEATLATLVPHFDDIVVLDTGSADDSAAIARQHGARVFDFAWVDDFAAARNASLEHARHDWVLVVDADERLARIDAEALAAALRAHPDGVGRVERLNPIDEDGGSVTMREHIRRLFRRSRHRYAGSIHEQVVARGGAGAADVSFLVPLVLDHAGYRDAVLAATGKVARNVALLERALERAPHDPYLLYQLGKSRYLQRDYAAAADSFEQALRAAPDMRLEYVEDLIETLCYALINHGDHAGALRRVESAPDFPSTDFAFLKASALMNAGRLQEAVDLFLQCTRMPPGRKEGVDSFKARHNIGVILECSGMPGQAREFYRACGDYAPAQAGLARLGAGSDVDGNAVLQGGFAASR